MWQSVRSIFVKLSYNYNFFTKEKRPQKLENPFWSRLKLRKIQWLKMDSIIFILTSRFHCDALPDQRNVHLEVARVWRPVRGSIPQRVWAYGACPAVWYPRSKYRNAPWPTDKAFIGYESVGYVILVCCFWIWNALYVRKFYSKLRSSGLNPHYNENYYLIR